MKKIKVSFVCYDNEAGKRLCQKQNRVTGKVESISEITAKQESSLRASCHEVYVKNGITEYWFTKDPTENLEKELHRIQRDLNSHRLLDYIPGDQSEQEQARQQERTAKIARFHEILNTLNGITA